MYGGSVCVPPSPSAAHLVLERIAAAQATDKDDSFSPSVFKVGTVNYNIIEPTIFRTAQKSSN